MLEARLIQRLTNRDNKTIHHVRRRDDVGARLCLRDRRASEQIERRVVQHFAVFDHSAMSVVGVFAQAVVRDHQHIFQFAFDRANCALRYSVLGISLAADSIFIIGHSEQDHRIDSDSARGFHFFHQLIDR